MPLPRPSQVAVYVADALLRAPALLGSLDVLGAPTRLIESVGAGFHDLVAMPAEAAAAGTMRESTLIQANVILAL